MEAVGRLPAPRRSAASVRGGGTYRAGRAGNLEQPAASGQQLAVGDQFGVPPLGSAAEHAQRRPVSARVCHKQFQRRPRVQQHFRSKYSSVSKLRRAQGQRHLRQQLSVGAEVRTTGRNYEDLHVFTQNSGGKVSAMSL